jgi:hypothetical protein
MLGNITLVSFKSFMISLWTLTFWPMWHLCDEGSFIFPSS